MPYLQSDGGQLGVKVEGGRSARGLDSVMEVKQEYKERQEGMVQSTINWTVSQLFTWVQQGQHIRRVHVALTA